MDLVASPSQTIGPFFHCYFAAYGTLPNVAGPHATGERIGLAFRVLDGDGAPLNDAMLELWQADVCGFGRLPTDEQGACLFDSVKPGCVAPQAPHINVVLFARGLLRHLYTRIYFADETAANGSDPLLAAIDDDGVRRTLLAERLPGVREPPVYRFDVVMQCENETAFLDI